MRVGALSGARAALLAGPVALAFFSGGYFDVPREWAGAGVWALVALIALASGRLLPRAGAPRLALAGLVGLGAWTVASIAWAPLAGSAYHAGQLVILYAGALLAAVALLRGRAVLRAAEIAVAAGALLVIAYGLSERLVPWLLQFHHDASADGRLDQPLTYWNATGELAAFGLVLCARLAGDATRSPRVRLGATAAAAPLGLGLYLTFSRGALFACAAGLVALAILAPDRTAWRSGALAAVAGLAGAAAGAPFDAVTALHGSHSSRVTQGTAALILLIAVMSAAALGQAVLTGRERSGELRGGPVRLPRGAGWIALALVLGGFALFLIAGAKEPGGATLATGANRLTTLQSNRYDYWRVAWRAFESEPLRGVGSGGWAVWWLRYRPFAEGAQDAHSLYVQTGAELGLVGLALLGAMLGAIAWSARSAHRIAPTLAAGPIAAVVVWAAHCAVDWDWEMPAVTLPALLLAGLLFAVVDGGLREGSAGAELTM